MSASSDALEIAREAIASIDLGERVRRAIADIHEPVVVAAVGKAAPAMARAALDALDVTRAVIVAPDGTDARGLDVLRASHPIPDERSVAAANALLDAARGAPLLLALISGGASSLACAPVEGVTLEQKQSVVRAMLESGASITDVNLVRRHLSRIKGGRLAAVADRTIALVVSDVIGGTAADVGSGPATPSRATLADARATLERIAPEHAGLARRMEECPAANAESRVIAEPSDLAVAAAEIAERRGLRLEVLPPTTRDAFELGHDYAFLAAAMTPGFGYVRVAEPSVQLPRKYGSGGRAGRVALTAWYVGLPDNVALACVASDGVDGSSGSAGAVVSGRRDGLAALVRYDDGPFLREHGAAVDLGPTGHNLCDLHLLVCV